MRLNIYRHFLGQDMPCGVCILFLMRMNALCTLRVCQICSIVNRSALCHGSFLVSFIVFVKVNVQWQYDYRKPKPMPEVAEEELA
jgi:hypothetical protein